MVNSKKSMLVAPTASCLFKIVENKFLIEFV